ncbi:MAG: ankyrin repeat domain-containing protein [Deltaproteobacteria bacterium]|nr:ankyrin repeat domain-containing protein [Deltaproteobacteria bacterium]
MRSTPVVAALTFSLVGWVACTPSPTSEPPPLSGPLHLVAWAGNVTDLRARLGDGAAGAGLVDEKERGTEWTPLHVAAMAGRVEAASLLLERGADPNARSRYDMTPLHWASLRGRAEVAALLVQRGARLDARTIYGLTPLHEAADERVARVLVGAGASLQAVDDRGLTPLHVARNKRVARALLEQGASLTVRSREGRTAWETAVWDQLEPRGITMLAARASARLRGDDGRAELSLRNVSVRAIDGVSLSAESVACTVGISPARVPTLQPGQMVTLALALKRRAGIGDGEHPLSLTVTAGGRPLGTVALRVDTTRHETPEDRGEIRLGRGALRPKASRWQYLAYAAVPVLVVVAWLVWRRRR